jgi:DnaA-homolog protein
MLNLKQSATLDNFIQGDNAQAVSELRNCTQAKHGCYLYLWGASGTGKTHLVTAAAKAADNNSSTVAYIPLSRSAELSPEMLSNIEHMDLICLDDIHSVAGDRDWEEALFHLFNRTRELATNLIVTADSGPSALQLNLPDLVSRLASGVSYRLSPLDDTTKMQLLVALAKKRGMQLTSDTANYILNNYSRDTAALLAFLERLDHASLAAQRKLTIPFIRTLITAKNP